MTATDQDHLPPHRPPAPGEQAAARPRRAFAAPLSGIVLSLVLSAAFIWLNLPDLPVNFQIDGQIPEFLAWAKDPGSLGASLNSELNQRLYSFYYAGLGYLAPVTDRLQLLCFVYGLEILAICAAVYFFILTLTRDAWAALLGVVVAIWGDGLSVALGGSGGIGLICGAEHPAAAMALVAMALSWRRRHVAAVVVAGLSFNLHGSSAIFVSAMVLTAAWADGGWRLRSIRLWLAAAVCLLAAAPTLVWIAVNPPPAGSMSTADWLRFPHWIYPHHMLISATTPRAWATLFVFTLPGIVGLWHRLPAGVAFVALRRAEFRNSMPALRGWLIAAALLLAVGYVFVELIPIRQVAQLTLWRGTRNLVMLCLAVGLAYLLRCVRDGGLVAVAAALALAAYVTPRHPELACLGHLGLAALLIGQARSSRGIGRVLIVVAALGVAVIALYEVSFVQQVGWYLRWRWPIAVAMLTAVFIWAGRAERWYRQALPACAMVTLALWLIEVGMFRHVPGANRRRAAALLELAPAIERACPAGQIVVAPPDLRSPAAWAGRGSFLCRQQLTAYAYGPWLADEIVRRMEWFLGQPVDQLPRDEYIIPRLCAGYRTRTEADFAPLRERYGVRLAIVERPRELAFKTVAENDAFVVYDLASPVP